jgi:hypothetical protein
MTTETDLQPLPSENVAHLIIAQAAEVEALRAELEDWKESFCQAEAYAKRLADALAGLITWVPSAATYRRLGFDPEAPMRALAEARAALET